MRSSQIHKKIFLPLSRTVILAVLFAVLLPTNIALGAAGDNWCAQYRDKGTLGLGGDKFPTIHCFNSLTLCTQTVTGSAAGGSITAQCADITQSSTATEPGQQRMLIQKTEEQRREASNASKGEDNLFPWAIGPLKIIPGLLAGLAFVVFKVAGLFITYMANIMDWSIRVSIDSQLLGSMQFVDAGWTAVRDFANMFFIFALLYIAIQTILGLAGGNAKRLLAHLIIAALLINFSLFMTKVVIDAGNILAVSIWSKMDTKEGGVTVDAAAPKLLGGLDLQTVFANNSDIRWTSGGYSYGKMMLIYAGGAVFMFIAGYIFLASALMMVTRTVMLLLLMVFSPFAFMALGLPKLEQYGHKWLDKLIKQTFVAPFFIFMLYLNSILVTKFDIFKLSGSKGQAFASALSGSGEYQIIFNFILLIGFLVASLAMANNFAGDVGSHARGWAKSATKWAGGLATGAAVGTGAFAMRQGLGKIGMIGKDNQTLHDMAGEKGWRGMVGRGAIAVSSGMTRATYDPRATKLGAKALSGGGKIDIGQAGGAGGFATTGSALSKVTLGSWGYTGTAADKEVLERAERRYANDPKGKEAYLRANLGSNSKRDAEGKLVGGTPLEKTKSLFRGTSRYEEAYEHKALREKVGREKDTKEYKDTLRENTNIYKNAAKTPGGLDKAYVGNDEKGNAIVGKTVGEMAAAAITKSLAKLNGKEASDTLTNEQLVLKPVIEALNNQHLAALNARIDLNPETITAVTNGIVASGTSSAQKYLRNQSRLGSGNFQVDAEKELTQLVTNYDAEKAAYDTATNRTPEIEKKWRDAEKEMKTQSGRFLGMMETAEVAELDNALITHEMLMEEYGKNSKVQQRIRERLKTGAYDDTVAQKLAARFGGQASKKQQSDPNEPPLPVIDQNFRS